MSQFQMIPKKQIETGNITFWMKCTPWHKRGGVTSIAAWQGHMSKEGLNKETDSELLLVIGGAFWDTWTDVSHTEHCVHNVFHAWGTVTFLSLIHSEYRMNMTENRLRVKLCSLTWLELGILLQCLYRMPWINVLFEPVISSVIFLLSWLPNQWSVNVCVHQSDILSSCFKNPVSLKWYFCQKKKVTKIRTFIKNCSCLLFLHT